MKWPWVRDDEIVPEPNDGLLTVEEFETEMEKRAINMLGFGLSEFRARAVEGELPDTPAVDHLRFLLGV